MSVTEIQKQALELPAEERALLADQLMQSLEDPEILKAWAAESEDRWAAFKRGEITARDGDEALAELRQQIQK